MQIETRASIYKADTFHSNKTNKDYFTLGLIIDGEAGNFFVTQRVFNDFAKTPIYNALRANPAVPQIVTVLLNLRFTDKGPQVNIDDVKPDKK